MGKREKRQIFSILSKQKLHRRKPRSLHKTPALWLLAVMLLAASGTYLSKRGMLPSPRHRPSAGLWEKIRVQIKPESGIAFDSGDYSRVEDIVRGSIRETGSVSLDRIARLLHKRTDYERVHVFRDQPDHLIVSLRKRIPILSVQADRLRFLTRDGIVYGEVRDNLSPLIRVTGIFSARSSQNAEMTDENTLVVSASEGQALKEAVELFTAATSSGLGIDLIDFQEFRGFVLHLTGDDVEVAIGRRPFENRLHRLKSVVSQLKKRGILFSRIELDYDGKAFIKEKKMEAVSGM